MKPCSSRTCHTASVRYTSPREARQHGQAMLEGILVLWVLACLWVAIIWLGQLQDIALSAQHASRHAAFTLARNPASDWGNSIRQHHFAGPAHQWTDRRLSMVNPELVHAHLDTEAHLPQSAQPGGERADAESLRRSWGIQDGGIVTARLRVAPAVLPRSNSHQDWASSLNEFNTYPTLRRHTAILVAAGHASSDAQVPHIVGRSSLAWSDSADASYEIGRRIDNAMSRVDAAWRRSRPMFDWLGPWAGDVPESRLVNVTEATR